MTTRVDVALPCFDQGIVVVPAPDIGTGNWAGGASALLHDGVFWLTYRVRRPIMAGRGVSAVVARSDDGVRFQTIGEVQRNPLERTRSSVRYSFRSPMGLAALRQLRDVELQALVGSKPLTRRLRSGWPPTRGRSFRQAMTPSRSRIR